MAIVIDGSANTIGGLAVGGLPDGIVDTDMIASSVSLGITHLDTWTLTTDKNWSGTNTFDADFSRNTNFPSIGSAMTMSSGSFVFPVTGIWEITLFAQLFDSTENAYCQLRVDKSTNSGGAWTQVAENGDSILDDGSNSVYCNPRVITLVDITNVSNDYVRFRISNEQGANIDGHASDMRTGAIFKRLGDT